MVVRMAFLKIFQKTLHSLAPGGKDSQADHDEKDPLKKREKEANDSDNNEEPPENQERNRFESGHIIILFDL